MNIMDEMAVEHMALEKFRQDCLLLMVGVCRQMRAVQNKILSEYGAAALFEDQYNMEAATTYLAKSIVNMFRAMRCIEGQSERNHVVPQVQEWE